MTHPLSNQDLRILELLQQDASLTTSEIASQTNMSQSPCWRRINKIEQAGLIKKRTAILDHNKLGFGVIVFATINLTTQGRNNLEEFESRVKTFPEVLECYTMAGIWDYMIKFVTKDIQHCERFIREHLTTMPMVRELHSHIAVTEIKNTTELPLRDQLTK